MDVSFPFVFVTPPVRSGWRNAYAYGPILQVPVSFAAHGQVQLAATGSLAHEEDTDNACLSDDASSGCGAC
jgi:hypothetical protein